MKILFFIPFLFIGVEGFSQKQTNEKEILLSRVYHQRNNNKSIINYDKSFVSDDRLFYESLKGEESVTISEEKLVRSTLQNYIIGSSYNQLDLIRRAFTKDATLYLTNREGNFKKYTPEEYAGFFKNGEPRKFNGRDGKILAVEIIKDIATAKVEIAGPQRKWVYIDLFLLKKIEGSWKIISKTATRVDENK